VWAAGILSLVLGLAGFLGYTFLGEEAMHLSGAEMGFSIQILVMAVFALLSWWQTREGGPVAAYPLDTLLSRGEKNHVDDIPYVNEAVQRGGGWKGFSSRFLNGFSKGDKRIFWGIVSYNLALFSIFVVLNVIRLFVTLPEGFWSGYWRIYIWQAAAVGIGVTVWLTWGGLKDAASLFSILPESSTKSSNHTDSPSTYD
jgi:hypothetical protein